MKNEIRLKFVAGYLNMFHNGTCVSFCRECPSYTIDKIDCGVVSVHTSICYWDDWDYVRLYVEVYLCNTLDLKSSIINIPLAEIGNFQNVYDKEMEGCEVAVRHLLLDLDSVISKLRGGQWYASSRS